jgi:hypothetical protein
MWYSIWLWLLKSLQHDCCHEPRGVTTLEIDAYTHMRRCGTCGARQWVRLEDTPAGVRSDDVWEWHRPNDPFVDGCSWAEDVQRSERAERRIRLWSAAK